MEVQIYDTFKDFWRYLKLFKLMFEAQPIQGGYHVALDGPISPFVAFHHPLRAAVGRLSASAAVVPAVADAGDGAPSAFDAALTYQLDHRAALTSTLPAAAISTAGWRRISPPNSRQNWAMNGASGF